MAKSVVSTFILQARKLDELFEAEEKLMGHSVPDTPLLSILKNPEYGSKEDKLRILLINYICNDVPEVTVVGNNYANYKCISICFRLISKTLFRFWKKPVVICLR